MRFSRIVPFSTLHFLRYLANTTSKLDQNLLSFTHEGENEWGWSNVHPGLMSFISIIPNICSNIQLNICWDRILENIVCISKMILFRMVSVQPKIYELLDLRVSETGDFSMEFGLKSSLLETLETPRSKIWWNSENARISPNLARTRPLVCTEMPIYTTVIKIKPHRAQKCFLMSFFMFGHSKKALELLKELLVLVLFFSSFLCIGRAHFDVKVEASIWSFFMKTNNC